MENAVLRRMNLSSFLMVQKIITHLDPATLDFTISFTRFDKLHTNIFTNFQIPRTQPITYNHFVLKIRLNFYRPFLTFPQSPLNFVHPFCFHSSTLRKQFVKPPLNVFFPLSLGTSAACDQVPPAPLPPFEGDPLAPPRQGRPAGG